jgi:hypothetical protein
MSDIPAPIQGAIDELVRQRDAAQARAISLASELATAIAEIGNRAPPQEAPPE